MTRLFILCFLLCGLFACEPTEQKPTVTTADLQGTWKITKAKRDGRPTESLDGAFFQFNENGSMTSNLLGDTMQMGYSLSGDTLVQQYSTPVTYIIKEKEDSLLVVNTVMRSTPFQFYLEKE